MRSVKNNLRWQDAKINEIMSYNKDYYSDMSFGKFTLSHSIHKEVRLSQPSSSPYPNLHYTEIEIYDILADEGYVHGTDFDGVMVVYRRTEDGEYRINGGWGNLNSESKLSLIPNVIIDQCCMPCIIIYPPL